MKALLIGLTLISSFSVFADVEERLFDLERRVSRIERQFCRPATDTFCFCKQKGDEGIFLYRSSGGTVVEIEAPVNRFFDRAYSFQQCQERMKDHPACN